MDDATHMVSSSIPDSGSGASCEIQDKVTGSTPTDRWVAPRPPKEGRHGAGWSSLGFWGCMFLAAGFYGMTALGPKLIFSVELAERLASNQRQMLRLESRTRSWNRLAAAWKIDNKFNAVAARSRYVTSPKDEQVIPLPESLQADLAVLSNQSDNADPITDPTSVDSRRLREFRVLLGRTQIRRSLLWIAGLLTLLAFAGFRGGD